MKENEVLHGFRVRYIQPLPELKATLYRMEYEKNGADLVWIEREDENKTFAMTFKTIPQDDTGVFHILEHSVLSGSEKYPLKSPFVEMMKRSLKTFMNAFTYPDRTMYPFSTRNGQDFLNLMDVYLDAVLHPLSLTDPTAFRREGWHYEMESPDSELTINGVVYNEMKGAYASPDTVLTAQMNRQLFPDNCYGFQSGGDPDHISELTYERYIASHRRFYHPSNSRIFLDGSIDIHGALHKLDSFLSDYDRIETDTDIPMQQPAAPGETTCYYEVASGSKTNRVLLAQGWVCGAYDRQETNLACSILSGILCSSNDAPLKKAVLDTGLAENIEMQLVDGVQQPYLMMTVRNTEEGKEEAVWSVIHNTLSGLADHGLDHEQLYSLIDHLEFTTRERDYGSMPRGVIYGMTAMETWLYGGDPSCNLCCGDLFERLRKKVEQGWFEKLLRSVLLDNSHQARVKLLPSETIGAQKRETERQRLAGIKASWNDEQIRHEIAEFSRFQRLQLQENTPEELAVLPVLSLKDIPEKQYPLPQEIMDLGGTTVLYHQVETEGIQYIELYFSLSDLTPEELSCAAFLASLLSYIGTDYRSAAQLRSAVNGSIGRFAAGVVVFSKGGTQNAQPCLMVQLSMLDSKRADVLHLIDEILLHSNFDDLVSLRQLLQQSITVMGQRIVMSGNSFAAQRALAGQTVYGALKDAVQGISYLRWQQRMVSDIEKLHGNLTKLFRSVFSRNRVTLGVTGTLDMTFLSNVLGIFPEIPMGAPAVYDTVPAVREGFVIPAQVGFAAKAGNLSQVGAAFTGAAKVAAQILSYGYLWETIRVKGGAYGTGLQVQQNGTVCFSSFRDPNVMESLAAYDGAGAELRTLCERETSLDQYIISTIAANDPFLTPRMKGNLAAEYYFCGYSDVNRQKLRSEILHTTCDDLLSFSQVLDHLCDVSGVCVIGGKEQLEDCPEKLNRVEMLQ